MLFEQIYTPANRRNVMNVCYRILRNDADAEDAAQVAFLNAFRRLDSFEAKNGATVETWLISIAKNAALCQLRKQPKWELVSLSLPTRIHPALQENIVKETTWEVPDPGPSPETLCFLREVQQIAQELPPQLREPLLLFQQGYSTHEIGLVLGIVSLATVRTRFSRGRQQIKKRITRKKR